MSDKPLTAAEVMELDAYGRLTAFTPLPRRAMELWEREIMWGRETPDPRTAGLRALVEDAALPILERTYPDEDCGCPVEEWVANGISLMIHFEEDGRMEFHADTGDWDMIVPLKATTMEAARAEAFAWAAAVPVVG